MDYTAELPDRPLKECILGSKSVESISLSISSRPPLYKQWTESKLYQAYEAYRNGMSIRRAAESFGVPKSTLSDSIKGKVSFGARSGPSTYLSDSEEIDNF